MSVNALTFSHAVLCCLLLGASAAAGAQQSRQDAWWTGPMLAPNAATLPQGHALIEPYLFDVITTGHFDANGNKHAAAREHDLGSLSYVLYGVTDDLTAGLIPRFQYNMPADAPNSSAVQFADLTLQVGYGLAHFHDGGRTPDISLVLQETLPTGRYDRLARSSDGVGAGAYTTTVNLYLQDYLWMPNGRILRARLDVGYAFSSSVSVQDVSVYGTPAGFSGRAHPGDSFSVDAAAEYSLTRSWVLALDIVYQHGDSTRVTGSAPAAPPQVGLAPFEQESGSSYSLGFAPAIEYNWSPRMGALLGVRIIEIGRNTAATITPAIALNMVF
ncbi:MAG: transporter [Gammaproteobacteria bacterium]|nr:transporter [Gammaproteobacteria bacterium]